MKNLEHALEVKETIIKAKEMHIEKLYEELADLREEALAMATANEIDQHIVDEIVQKELANATIQA